MEAAAQVGRSLPCSVGAAPGREGGQAPAEALGRQAEQDTGETREGRGSAKGRAARDTAFLPRCLGAGIWPAQGAEDSLQGPPFTRNIRPPGGWGQHSAAEAAAEGPALSRTVLPPQTHAHEETRRAVWASWASSAERILPPARRPGFSSLGRGEPLEEGCTHSSILT